MKPSKKIVIGILILLVLILAGYFAANYLKQEGVTAFIPEITEDEAIDLAKNCQVEGGFYEGNTTVIDLKDNSRFKFQGTGKFSDTVYEFEDKCGQVPIFVID